MKFIFLFILLSSFTSTLFAQDIYKIRMSKYELAAEYSSSCKRGELAGCYMLGRLYKKLKNPKMAKQIWKKACQQGEPASCEELRGGILAGTGSDLLFYSALALIGIAVLIVVRMTLLDEEEFKAQEKLEEGADGKENIAKYGPILKYSRPFFKRYVTPIVASLKNKKKFKKKYRHPIASSGMSSILTPEDFYSFKIFLIIAFPIVFLVMKFFMEVDWPLSYIPIIAILGFFYPDLWISQTIKARQKEVLSNMPFAVDMLALSVEAGLDFIAAMKKVVEKAKPSALTEEFENLMKEIQIGSSRAEALRNMAWRVDLIQVSSFCATLIAADSVGASIGPILKALSGEMRQKRSSDVEKAGATAATKILIPMMFLILPAVILMVFAPIGLEAMYKGK